MALKAQSVTGAMLSKGILTGGAIGGIISGVSEIAGAVGEVVSSAMEAQTEVAKIGFTYWP